MKLTKWFSGLAIVFLLLSLVVTVGAAPSTNDVVTASTVVNSSEIMGSDRPSGAGGGRGDKTPPVVEILEPAGGEPVWGTGVLIRATATDDSGIKKVEYAIDSAGWTPMAKAGDGTYQATWDSTTVADGPQTITVRATDNRNNKGDDFVTVNIDNGGVPPPPPAQYELFIEIDYMTGHYPTTEVLQYIEWYYMGNNPSGDLIKVTFYIDDVVSLDRSVSDAEFWAIEAQYNDLGDDKYTGDSASFFSEWKWVLFGTTVAGAPGVVGYAYIKIDDTSNDVLAGNYMFIADQTADTWSARQGLQPDGAEAVVLMHEMGHSIGIAVWDPVVGEIYDLDRHSVMSYLSRDNATEYNSWYYSGTYWDTRNMQYYEVG
jgi:hypothetical protein